MIDDLDRTIRELLTQELTRRRRDRVEIAFNQPNREWRREGSALNFFLYDVRENVALRQLHWQEAHREPTGSAAHDPQQMRLQRTPLRLDCFYMVTAWSADPMDEHRLLSDCLLILARYPILNLYELEDRRRAELTRQAERSHTPPTAGQLERQLRDVGFMPGRSQAALLPNGRANGNGTASGVNEPRLVRDYLAKALQNLAYEVRTRLAYHDVMTNPAEIWSSLENTMKAAISYVVTLPINPWAELEEVVTPAGTATFTATPTQRLPDESAPQRVAPQPADFDRPRIIGGLVKMTKPPKEGLEVWLVELGRSARPDAAGRFVFRRIPPGSYRLEVRPYGERGQKGEPTLAFTTVTVAIDPTAKGHLTVIDVDQFAANQPATAATSATMTEPPEQTAMSKEAAAVAAPAAPLPAAEERATPALLSETTAPPSGVVAETAGESTTSQPDEPLSVTPSKKRSNSKKGKKSQAT